MLLPGHRWPKSWSNIEEPIVPHEQIYMVTHLPDYCGKIRNSSVGRWTGESSKLGVLFLCIVDDVKMAGKKQNLDPMWKKLMTHVELVEPASFLDHVYLGCSQCECEPDEGIVDEYRNMFESRISAGATEKLFYSEKSGATVTSWSYDMEGHAKKCVERNCEMANKTIEQLSPHRISSQKKEMETVGELSRVSQFDLKCLARIGILDILWSVNKLARAAT